jgi:hypothetical protein
MHHTKTETTKTYEIDSDEILNLLMVCNGLQLPPGAEVELYVEVPGVDGNLERISLHEYPVQLSVEHIEGRKRCT